MTFEKQSARRVTKESKLRLVTHIHLPEHIAQNVTLKKSGNLWMGKCPFHDDSTASFTVYPDHYYCFGCKAHGDVIEYEIKKTGAPFNEVIESLASRYRVTLDYTGESKQETEQDRLFKQYRHIMEEVADHFHKILMHPQHGEAARRYLAERGFDQDFLREWKLGLSLNQNTVVTLAEKRGWKKELLVTLGLIRKSNRDSGHYDFFNDRIMITICDERGQAIAFGGRLYKTAKAINSPKYLNSPETPLFSKSNTLYNLHNARRFTLKEQSRLIVVEGYLDALALAKANFQNVVAVLGTALTNEHIRKMCKYADEVLVCFDQDNAGRVASLRSFQIAFPLNLVTLNQVEFSGAKDPDEFLQQFGNEAFANCLKKAPPMVQALAEQIKKEHANPEAQLKEIRSKLLPSIMANPDVGTKELALNAIVACLKLSSIRALLGQTQTKNTQTEPLPKTARVEKEATAPLVWSIRAVEEARWCAALLFAKFEDLPDALQALLKKSSSAQEQLFVKGVLLRYFSRKSAMLVRRLLEQMLLHPTQTPFETMDLESTRLSEVQFLWSLAHDDSEFFRENNLGTWLKPLQGRPVGRSIPRPDNLFEPANKTYFFFMMKDLKMSFEKGSIKQRLTDIWTVIEISYLDSMIHALMNRSASAEAQNSQQYQQALRVALEERNKRNLIKVRKNS